MSNRYANLHKLTPALCRRAGGRWCGWTGDQCVGAHCEICGAALLGIIGARAHIHERRSDKDDNMDNLIIACPQCHNHDRFPDGGLACGTEKALQIVRIRRTEEK